MTPDVKTPCIVLAAPDAGDALCRPHPLRGPLRHLPRERRQFTLTPATELVKDGAPATAEDLKPSTRVVVHAKKKDGRMEAVKVQFSSKRKP
jgi:hypothetical protein